MSRKLTEMGLGYGDKRRRLEFLEEFFKDLFGLTLLAGKPVSPCQAKHGLFPEQFIPVSQDLLEDLHGPLKLFLGLVTGGQS